jgi:thimet oligopeptidase
MNHRSIPFVAALMLAALLSVLALETRAAEGAALPGTVAEVESSVQAQLAKAESLRAQLASGKVRKRADVLRLWNELALELDAAESISSLLAAVHPDAAVRAEAEKSEQQAKKFDNDLKLDRKVYDVLAAVDLKGAPQDERWLVTRTLRDYRLAGVDRDPATRDRIRALREEIVLIEQEFSRNIREGERYILLESAAELEGLPADFIAAHLPDANGRIKITTQYPDYIPFMTYAKSADARRRLLVEDQNRAFPQNEAVLNRLLAKRHELAGLLGFANWADYITADKMIGGGAKVSEFVERLRVVTAAGAERDYQMMLARKRKDDPTALTIAPYEVGYYQNLVRLESAKLDQKELRQYFDYPRVKQGIFDLTSTLFGLTIRRDAAARTWHPAVEAYELLENGRVVGRFYMDMHPREGKYNHAAMFFVRPGVAGRQLPEAALVCNFPGGDGASPALMEWSDVSTFLHEFGHLLHTLLAGQGRWVAFGSGKVEWDFVEAPSQLLEEWALDAKTLQTFAVHHETGAPIPTDLVQRLRDSRELGRAMFVARQNAFSALSLALHNRDPKGMALDQVNADVHARFSPIGLQPGMHVYASFNHLDGYSAIYYTYMWSLVIAQDLFSRFDRSNLLDPRLGTEYRSKVLGPGSSRPAADLVENFLGRPYGFQSFEKWLNAGATTGSAEVAKGP